MLQQYSIEKIVMFRLLTKMIKIQSNNILYTNINN